LAMNRSPGAFDEFMARMCRSTTSRASGRVTP
jgi:hypothetical protein